MKVFKIENDSGWNFEDLLNDYGKKLAEVVTNERYYTKKSLRNVFEEILCRFIESLPSGYYYHNFGDITYKKEKDPEVEI